MQNEKSKRRGGRRDGAGRPTLTGGMRRVALPARVHPGTMAALRTIAQKNDTSVGALIDEMVNDCVLRSQSGATSNASPPRPEDFSSKKKLIAARQQRVIGVLSKLFSDGTFEPHELKHFLLLDISQPAPLWIRSLPTTANTRSEPSRCC